MRQHHVDLIKGAASEATAQLREVLGKHVREVWLAWARMQPDAKRAWINAWEDVEERHREVDRDIGEALFNMGRQSVVDELMASLDDWRVKLRGELNAGAFASPEERSLALERRRAASQALDRVYELLEARHVEGPRLTVPKALQ